MAVGRPKFKVTDDLRKQVEKMSGLGLTQEQISSVIGCSIDTLYKNFKEELESGKSKAIMQVSQTLFKKAVEGNMTAAIFFLKTQAKWKETSVQEITGSDGGHFHFSDAKEKLLAGIIIKKDLE